MDREKVIRIIDELIFEAQKAPTWKAENALRCLKKELLKEPVEPKAEKAILDYQSWHYVCGDCGGQIDIQDNYCRHCGRVVAHLTNKI